MREKSSFFVADFVIRYPYSILELAAFRALRFQSLLLEIEKLPSPVDRILQVTSWFLTSMEQMENMSKKPFNPVLGEELSCCMLLLFVVVFFFNDWEQKGWRIIVLV
jgi:hypothetical protein